MLRRAMIAGSAGGYNALMSSLTPLGWWMLEETSGTSVADSSGNSYHGTAAATIAGGYISPVVSGFEGVGRGVSGVQVTVTGMPDFRGNAAGAWTIAMWLIGAAGSNQYIMSRGGNNGAFIYNYVAGYVELFRNTGGSGSDPRPNSQIALSASGTTPDLIVYRYNNGSWCGFKNGSKVFDVSRSFALGGGSDPWVIMHNGPGGFKGLRYDISMFNRALSDADILAMWNARGG